MAASEKQRRYIKALLVERQMLHERYGTMSGSTKHLPHGPSMRERADVDAWLDRLTVRQASEVIDALRAMQ